MMTGTINTVGNQLTGQTGSGAFVGADSPTLTTPTLGAASATSLSLTDQLTVDNGGTGVDTLTTYAILCGGTTSTGAIQQVSGPGASGQLLTSNGASTLPTWQDAPGGGGVNPGTINDLGYYASTGSTISALSTANNSVLVTDGSGVPSLSTTLPANTAVTNPKITTSIEDANGNKIIGLNPLGSAVNYVQITNDTTGNAPIISANGSDANISLAIQPKGTGNVLLKDYNSNIVLETVGISSAVNYFSMENSATGGTLSLFAKGTDSNINLNMMPKGTGHVLLTDGAGKASVDARGIGSSAVNYLFTINAATGNNPIMAAAGSDTNVTLQLEGQGTGGVAVHGVADGSSAASGYVGQYIESKVPVASGITVSPNTVNNLTSISLPPGDWDVEGNIYFTYTAATMSLMQGWLSTTSSTLPDNSLTCAYQTTSLSALFSSFGMVVPKLRVNATTTTTVYITGKMNGSTNVTMCGNISARRVR